MKKIIVGLVILMPIALGAALSNGGGMGNWKSKQDSNGDVVFKTLAVDGNGTPIPTPAGGGGAAVVVTNTTPIPAAVYPSGTPIPVTQATPTPGIPGVSLTSNTSSYAGVTLIAYVLSATTPTVVNITSAAGVNVPCLVCMGSNGGAAAGFKVGFPPSATVPNWIYQGLGHYIAASTTSQCFGPFNPGTHWIGLGVAASSSAFVEYQQAK